MFKGQGRRFLGKLEIWCYTLLFIICLGRTDIPINSALRLQFGKPGREIYAPIAPGLISTIMVKNWELFSYDKKFIIDNLIGTIALDGERELEIYKKNILEISLEKSGPLNIKPK